MKKTCNVCNGRGRTTNYESHRSPYNSGPLYINVPVKKLCLGCGGQGTIQVAEPIKYKPPIKKEETYDYNGKFDFDRVGDSEPIVFKETTLFSRMDRWLEKRFPKKTRKWIAFILGGIGALIGYSYAFETGSSPEIYAITGAIIGFFLIGILDLLIKLLITLIIIVLIGLGIYVIYKVII